MSNDFKFENRASLIGRVNNVDYDKDIGVGLGKVGINADGNYITVNFWEKRDRDGESLNIVRDFVHTKIETNEKYEVQGELNEREYDGRYIRQLTNSMISKDGIVYGFNKVADEEEEKAIVKLSGDILSEKMDMVDTVRGEEVDKLVPKLGLEIAIYNRFNPDSEKEFSKREVVINELKNGIYYLENNGKDVDSRYKDWLEQLKDSYDQQDVHSITEQMAQTSLRLFKINVLHLVAYGDLAEQLGNEIDIGYNVTFGCDILTKIITDEYDIVQGNMNEIEVKSFGGVNAKAYEKKNSKSQKTSSPPEDFSDIKSDEDEEDDFDW